MEWEFPLQMEGILVILHLLEISFTKRYLFCFKRMNNFYFLRQVRKVTILGSKKRRTRLKKLHRFHFPIFSRTTSKKPSRFTQIFEVISEGFLSIEMKVDFSLFRSKSSFFTFFTRVRHFCSKSSLEFHKDSHLQSSHTFEISYHILLLQ